MSKIDTETNKFECKQCWDWLDLSLISKDDDNYCKYCYEDLKQLDAQLYLHYNCDDSDIPF